jgi:two-component system sensor histidine kinase YesM
VTGQTAQAGKRDFSQLITRQIKQYLVHTSLKKLLFWLFIPMFFVCILINFFLSNILMWNQIRANALISIAELVSQTKQHLDYRFYGIFEQFVLFEQSTDVGALIANTDESESRRLQRFVTVFKEMERIYYASYSALDTVFLAIREGTGPIDIFYLSDYPPARSDFSFSLVMNDEPLINQSGRSYQWYNLHENVVNPNIYTSNERVSLYKVLGDESSTSRCLLLFNFKTSFFRQIIGGIKVMDNGYLALLGDDVALHFKPDPERYDIPEHIVKSIEEDTSRQGYTTYKDSRGETMLAVWESLQLGTWKLTAVFPENDLMRSVNNTRLITAVCSLLVIGLILGLSFLIIRLISNPINRWVGKVSNLYSGSSDFLLDDAICAEIVELNRGISRLMERVQQLNLEKMAEEAKKRELEIRFLQERIKPHFLYNTLYSIEQLGNRGEYGNMIELIKSLNGFCRFTLSKGRDLVELRDEIKQAEYYLKIQLARYPGISYSIHVEPELMTVKIIKLILQPLLENAVFHAIKHGEDLGLAIRAERRNNNIHIEVKDNGIGIPENKLELLREAFVSNDWSKLPDAYGLRNVHERLRLQYGFPCGLSIESVFEEGTTVTILMPRDRE